MLEFYQKVGRVIGRFVLFGDVYDIRRHFGDKLSLKLRNDFGRSKKDLSIVKVGPPTVSNKGNW